MLRYTRTMSEPPLHRSVYQMGFLLTALFGINITAFWTFTAGNEDMVKRWEIMPLLLFAAIVGMFLWPFGGWHKRGRWRFLRYAQFYLRLDCAFSRTPMTALKSSPSLSPVTSNLIALSIIVECSDESLSVVFTPICGLRTSSSRTLLHHTPRFSGTSLSVSACS